MFCNFLNSFSEMMQLLVKIGGENTRQWTHINLDRKEDSMSWTNCINAKFGIIVLSSFSLDFLNIAYGWVKVFRKRASSRLEGEFLVLFALKSKSYWKYNTPGGNWDAYRKYNKSGKEKTPLCWPKVLLDVCILGLPWWSSG